MSRQQQVTRLFCLWIGDELPLLGRFAMTTWLQNGYEVEFFYYNKTLLEQIPEGILATDAREIIEEEQIFPEPTGRSGYSGFSNLFRIELMQKRDGLWVDLDVIGLDAIPELTDYVFAKESKRWINGAVFRCPADSDLYFFLRQKILAEKEKGYWEFGELGPRAITFAVQRFGLEDKLWPSESFYGLSGIDSWMLYSTSKLNSVSKRLRQSPFIHISNELSKQIPFSPLGLNPQPNSYLWNLKPEFWQESKARTITGEELGIWRKRAAYMKVKSSVAPFIPQQLMNSYLKQKQQHMLKKKM